MTIFLSLLWTRSERVDFRVTIWSHGRWLLSNRIQTNIVYQKPRTIWQRLRDFLEIAGATWKRNLLLVNKIEKTAEWPFDPMEYDYFQIESTLETNIAYQKPKTVATGFSCNCRCDLKKNSTPLWTRSERLQWCDHLIPGRMITFK